MTGTLEKRLAEAEAAKATSLPKMLHSGEFVSGYVPADYLIDNLIQKRNIYSLTGPTGAGKTAVMLCTASYVALGLEIGHRDVVKSKVLYLAGENPDDVRARWIAQCEAIGVEPADIDVYFIDGVTKLSEKEVVDHVQAQSEANGPFGLVIVDTASAHFTGDNENDNVQAGAHARLLRTLVNLPGGPTVITPAHPLKHPDMENLLPRGGGAFLAEVDGNLVTLKSGSVVEIYWHGKFRGPDFQPVPFKLEEVFSDKLRDSKGRLIKTVIAKPITQTEAAHHKEKGEEKQDQLLALMKARPGLSMRDQAKELGWTGSDKKPNISQVQRTMAVLYRLKLVTKKGEKWIVTKKGSFTAGAWDSNDKGNEII